MWVGQDRTAVVATCFFRSRTGPPEQETRRHRSKDQADGSPALDLLPGAPGTTYSELRNGHRPTGVLQRSEFSVENSCLLGGAVQFIDQARITVRGGRGGDGIAAFRREKYVPAGGPSGGDGGHGGQVVLRADSNLQTLLDFKYKRLFAADDGRRGGPNKCTGASGRNLVVNVPCGTEARHLTSGVLLGDLVEPGQQLVVAFGGRGGLGNAHYLSNRNRAPEKFTEGRDGEEWPLQLELKLLAEVGIIGLPNAGKSTLIAVLSAARPKIADYPFTTLVPNLGVVRRPSGDGTVFADIPV